MTETPQTPYYIVYEEKLRNNMRILKSAKEKAGINIIMAFKANALWKTFPIIREYFKGSTASSLNEMKLSLECLGKDVHAYCPVYTDDTFPDFLKGCSHITFNSVDQFKRFYPIIKKWNEAYLINKDLLENGGNEGKSIDEDNLIKIDGVAPRHRVSPGLRINPECSVVETDIYNPSLPGSRFGVDAKDLTTLPEGIEGLHFHALCESSSYDLERVINALEAQFALHLDKIKWLNMGGGHLFTRQGYNIDHLASIIKDFKKRHPNSEIIIEPGSAFTWQTGDLKTTVLDIVENAGIKTAIIDASFACHMPDCLEMPYKPMIKEALKDDSPNGYSYRLGGNSCLSGDFVGDWKFENQLKPGDILTLCDMNHYTTVKTTMFNGLNHPSIWLEHSNGELECLRKFDYNDYKNRMD